MPLSFSENINNEAIIIVWEMSEELSFFEKKMLLHISEAEKRLYTSFKSEKRKREWLATRYTLMLKLGQYAEIKYSKTNQPFLDDLFLSISHSENYVAIIISTNHKVALDIEEYSEKATRIIAKFLNKNEKKYLEESGSNLSQKASAMWCIKETGYKLYGKKKVDFVHEMFIENFSVEKNAQAVLHFKKEDFKKKITIKLLFKEHFILAYTIDNQ